VEHQLRLSQHPDRLRATEREHEPDLQTLGGSLDDLSYLWIAAPIIGHYSDRTWTRFGRRRPYFFAGAVLAARAMFAMPEAPILWLAAIALSSGSLPVPP
jgi:hypothetical protein